MIAVWSSWSSHAALLKYLTRLVFKGVFVVNSPKLVMQVSKGFFGICHADNIVERTVAQIGEKIWFNKVSEATVNNSFICHSWDFKTLFARQTEKWSLQPLGCTQPSTVLCLHRYIGVIYPSQWFSGFKKSNLKSPNSMYFGVCLCLCMEQDMTAPCQDIWLLHARIYDRSMPVYMTAPCQDMWLLSG